MGWLLTPSSFPHSQLPPEDPACRPLSQTEAGPSSSDGKAVGAEAPVLSTPQEKSQVEGVSLCGAGPAGGRAGAVK